MTTRTILDVGKITSGQWLIVHQDSDTGEKKGTTFYEGIVVFGSRAAEYGIDYHDWETLVDVAMHEFHFGVEVDDPTHLYNTDEKTAREAHMERVRKSKETIQYADPDNHLDKLKQAHFAAYNEETQRKRKQNVASLRERRAREKR